MTTTPSIPSTFEISSEFRSAFTELTTAANQARATYTKFKADLAFYRSNQLAKLAPALRGNPFTFLAVVLSIFTSSAPSSTTNPRGDATLTGLYETQVGLAGDHIAVMAALTKCTNIIEDVANNKTGDTTALRQNGFAINLLLIATDTSAGTSPDVTNGFRGILRGDPTDAASAPLDIAAVDTYRSQLRSLRSDIFLTSSANVADGTRDAQGVLYNPTEVLATASPFTRTYHLSTRANAQMSTSYQELFNNAKVQGSGGGTDDASRGARDALQTMTNAFQVMTQTTQTTNSVYNLEINQQTKSAQNVLAFISALIQMTSHVMKTIVSNSVR